MFKKRKRRNNQKDELIYQLIGHGLYIQATALKQRKISMTDAQEMIDIVEKNPLITFSQSIRA